MEHQAESAIFVNDVEGRTKVRLLRSTGFQTVEVTNASVRRGFRRPRHGPLLFLPQICGRKARGSSPPGRVTAAALPHRTPPPPALSPVSPTAPGTATCPREAAAPGRHGPRRPRPPPAPSRLARCREPRAHLLCSGGLRALSPPRRQEEELRCGRSWDGKPGTPSLVPSACEAKCELGADALPQGLASER